MTSSPLLTPLFALAVIATAISIAPAAHSTETDRAYIVAPADLILTVAAEGRIDSADRQKVRFAPEGFSGSLRVMNVAIRSGRVKPGDILVRLEDEELRKALQQASESLKDARRAMDSAALEAPMILESAATALQRAQWNHLAAQHAWDTWQKFESNHMLKNAELGLQSREFSLADQREELQQLEKMYEGAKLADETREIVLERARRSVMMSEEYLTIARENLDITRSVRHPDRHRELEQALNWAAIELAHAKVKANLADSKAAAMTEGAERAVRDAFERVDKLQRDQRLRNITAPAHGVITPIDLKPGDKVAAGAVVCEFLDANQLVARFDIGETELRVIRTGQTVTIAFPSFGEIEASSTVGDVSLVGSPSGESKTAFACTAPIEARDSMLRPGMRCAIRAEQTLPNVLAVPRKAVATKNGVSTCTVRTRDSESEVIVRLGAGNDEMVQIVDGLKAGDEVVIPVEGDSKE